MPNEGPLHSKDDPGFLPLTFSKLRAIARNIVHVNNGYYYYKTNVCQRKAAVLVSFMLIQSAENMPKRHGHNNDLKKAFNWWDAFSVFSDLHFLSW